MTTITNNNDYLRLQEIGEIDNNNYIITEQNYLNNLPETNAGVLYSNNRFVPSEEKQFYFFVEDLYFWFTKYVIFDEETQNFLKNVYGKVLLKDPNNIFTLGKGYSFIGYACINENQKIFKIHLRNISFSDGPDIRMFLNFLYNTKENKLVYVREIIRPEYPFNLNKFIEIKDLYWHTNKTKPIDPNKPIVITEGIYDANFFDNSIALGGNIPGLAIPKKYKNSNLIFILDNTPGNKNIYRVSKNALKMGYKVFTWPKSMFLFKDFNDYVRDIYQKRALSFKIEGINAQPTNFGFKFRTIVKGPSPYYSNFKYIFPTDQFIREMKGHLYKTVFLEDNLLGNRDLETFETRYSRK